jgi:hypothetical protein
MSKPDGAIAVVYANVRENPQLSWRKCKTPIYTRARRGLSY